MYKVIDGHKYDTNTARELAEWEPNPHRTDFSWFCETLYRTKTGLYFLHGEGGPMSRYAETISQSEWSGGEKILPISEDKAREWTEEHCSGETYERVFGDPEGDARKFTIALGPKEAARFDEIKKASGKSYTELLSGWIWEYKL